MIMNPQKLIHSALRHTSHVFMILLGMWPGLTFFCGSPAIAAPIILTDSWITPALRSAQTGVGDLRTVLIHVCETRQDCLQHAASVRQSKSVRGSHSEPTYGDVVPVRKIENGNHEAEQHYRPRAAQLGASRPDHRTTGSKTVCRPECQAAANTPPVIENGAPNGASVMGLRSPNHGDPERLEQSSFREIGDATYAPMTQLSGGRTPGSFQVSKSVMEQQNMSKKVESVSAPIATASSPVCKKAKWPKLFEADGARRVMPPLESRWIAKWRRWQQTTVRNIKKALAQPMPSELARDWVVGEILNWGFAHEENEFEFIHLFVSKWTPDEIALQCGLEPKKLWGCWRLAMCFTRETLDQLVDLGVSRERMRDLMRLLWSEGSSGALAFELSEVVPRTRDSDAREAFCRWIDLKLQKHQPEPVQWQTASPEWGRGRMNERYLRKARLAAANRRR